jgi:hypothetical protein
MTLDSPPEAATTEVERERTFAPSAGGATGSTTSEE